MVSLINGLENHNIEEQSYGLLIHQLFLLSSPNACYRIEPSIIIDNSHFLFYKQTSILQEGLVEEVLGLLDSLQITEADVYPSFYKDCLSSSNPIKIRVSHINIQNAITSIYNRWYDGKSYSQRIVRHLEESETYPAILIQSHRNQELTMITRHPRTGRLMRGSDGMGLVHCTKSIMDELEESTVEAIDSLIDQPVKIYYAKETQDSIVIRRVEYYPMTADARVNYAFSKYGNHDEYVVKLLNSIQPEDIVTICTNEYELTSRNQFSGLDASPGRAVKGTAVFPWTDPERISGSSIFMAMEAKPEDISVLKKCCGAIFSRGGATSHGAVACRGFQIRCICRSQDLWLDNCTKRAFVNNSSQNSMSISFGCQEIREGDPICIAGNKWALGGEVIPLKKSRLSMESRQKFGSLLKQFTNENVLRAFSLNNQLHIAKLIRALKDTGWEE